MTRPLDERSSKMAAAVFGVADADRRSAGNAVAAQMAPIPVTRVLDPARSGVWTVARHAWSLLLETDADWLLCGQDDAILCDNFAVRAAEALAQAPTNIVAFMVPNRRTVTTAEKAESHWVLWNGAWPVVMAFTRQAAQRMVNWVDATIPPSYPHDDGRYSLYADHFNDPIALTVPGLVDHNETLKSTLGGNPGRTAHAFIAPGETVDWTPPAKIPRIPVTYGAVSKRLIIDLQQKGLIP